jgi:hypothetical protein
MTDVINFTKQAFTWSVVAMTIVWSLGLAALAPVAASAATCPTIDAGELVKFGTAPAVYVVDEDMALHTFTNPEQLGSWGLSTADVTTVDATCINNYNNPSSMAGRGFSYGLMKPEIGATVYLLALDGAMYSIPTAEVAEQLWGANWGSAMRGIAPFLASNYRINSATELSLSNLPNEIIVSYGGKMWVHRNGTVFPIEGTVNSFVAARAIIGTDAMVAGLTVSDTTVSAASLFNVLRDFDMVSTPTTPGTETPAPAGALTVSLAASTPSAMLVPEDAIRVPFTTFNLRAGSSAVTVDTLTVRRTGLSNSSMFSAVWVERDGVRVSSRQGSATNDVFTLTFSPALTIAANQTVSLDVVASLDSAAGTGALSVASVTAGSASVSGAPVTGNMMSFVSYELSTFGFDASTSLLTPATGETDVELASFTLNGDADNDLLFKSLMLRNDGNEDMGRTLANVTLQHNGEVVSSVGSISGRYITFSLNNGGFLMEDGDFYDFKVVGDIVTKEKTATPSLSFRIHRSEDISVVEKSTGFGISSDDIPTNGVNMNDVNFEAGVVTVSKKGSSPSNTNVVKGSKNVLALVANVKADEAISAEGLFLEATGDTSSFDNVKVTLNGTSLGTVDADSDMEFETSFTLNKGDNELRVYVDASNDLGVEGDSIQFQITPDFLDFPEYVVSGNSVDEADISANVNSATITILGAELSMVRNDGFLPSRQIVVGAENVLLARFNTKALNDDITITSIVVTPTIDSTINTSAVSNMQIFIGGAQVGPTRNFNNSGATFSSLNYAMSKDATRPLEVRASFDNSTTGAIRFNVTVNFRDSRGKTGDPSDDNVSQITTVISAGTLSAVIDADTPEADIMVASGSSVEQTLAIYKFSALKDAADVTELVFASASSSADFLVNEFRLYRGATLVGTANPFSGTTTFKFTPGTLVLGADTNETLALKVVLNAIDEIGKSGKELGVELVSGLYLASNGSEEVLDVTGNTESDRMELRSTRPTFALSTLSTNGIGTVNEELLRFTITADAGRDVRINELQFTVSGSGAATTTGFQLYEGNTVRGTSTSTPEWEGLTITVAAGTTKTFTVRANTTNVGIDQRVAVTLDRGTDGKDISWSEVFVDGVGPEISGIYLHSFPVSHSKRF